MTITFSKIQDEAKALGFSLCGVVTNFAPKKQKYFLDWLKQKKFAGMEWLGKNTDKRLQPSLLFENTKSILVLAISYNHDPQPSQGYRIARYAHGQDYHLWVKGLLEKLAQKIKQSFVDFAWRSFVDTGPILERDLAGKAGIGWIGKNTCLLNEKWGSYLFLGVILNNLEFVESGPALNQCGSCRLCLEVCPTQALTPYQLDPYKCLAYQNIERRGARDAKIVAKMHNWLIGCDICQEVCPWNRGAPKTLQKNWLKSFADYDLGSFDEIQKLDKKTYQKKIKDSAISRIRFEDFMRNVEIVQRNSKLKN